MELFELEHNKSVKRGSPWCDLPKVGLWCDSMHERAVCISYILCDTILHITCVYPPQLIA